MVELRDVMPTILEACGAEIPESVDGQSVLPLCRGEATEWRTYLHGEHTAGEKSNHWITDGKSKYIWFSQTGREQFFDLTGDPQELQDLIDDPGSQESIQRFRQWLIEELTGREEGFTDGTSPSRADPSNPFWTQRRSSRLRGGDVERRQRLPLWVALAGLRLPVDAHVFGLYRVASLSAPCAPGSTENHPHLNSTPPSADIPPVWRACECRQPHLYCLPHEALEPTGRFTWKFMFEERAIPCAVL